MICFEVSLNGTVLNTAGIGTHGVLSTIITWVRRQRERSSRIHVSLGGLEVRSEPSNSLSWLNEDLKVGDTVSLRVLEQESADPPRHSSREQLSRIPKRVLLRQELTMLNAQLKKMHKRSAALERELQRERTSRKRPQRK